METGFLILVIILFVLAISDLVVGVSNDAVNFLNSAIGSKAFPFWAIMIIASLGIIAGATFSSGMMEVARKGIFHPHEFVFSEIMIIFVAVMLTDILLLDLFNTLSMPTSTTVSIVFELLGAAVAVSVIKVSTTDGATLDQFINSGKALAIISGILLSVIIAFTLGTLVQYITRLIFTFNYKSTYKYFIGIWGSIAITAIIYFIIIKGASGSSFITESALEWIKQHTLTLITGSFIFWLVILQLIAVFTRWNILRFTILVGTFALAMAFAGNDLVNFIGVPLAGLKSYQTFMESGAGNPGAFSMEALQAEVATPTLYLLLAGIIMVITLWLSRKAHAVTQTEINLSRQREGYERFGATGASRSIVRTFIAFSNGMASITPKPVRNFLQKRFKAPKESVAQEDKAAYDMIRASVNLTVASIIISFATSLKLPLSTTYVTFMVAMGTSLADGAWGRESAVYRITGVLSVIGGWFFTAIIAFTAAFIFANLISWGGIYVVLALFALAAFLLLRSNIFFKKRSSKQAEEQKLAEEARMDDESIFESCNQYIIETLIAVSRVFKQTIIGLSEENRKKLKQTVNETEAVRKQVKQRRSNVHLTIHQLEADSIETGHYYVQGLDYMKEIINSLLHITRPSYDHILNNHRGLQEDQTRELLNLSTDVRELFKNILRIIKENRFNDIQYIIEEQRALLDKIHELRRKQLKRIKNAESTSTKNNILYLDLLSETKNVLLYTINLLKAQKDFVLLSKPQDENM